MIRNFIGASLILAFLVAVASAYLKPHVSESDDSLVGKMDLETGQFTAGPAFKPGDIVPMPPPVQKSPIPVEVLKDLKGNDCILVEIAGQIEQDYDLNNDNAPSGYLLIDDNPSASGSGGRDAFQLRPIDGGKYAALLSRLADENGKGELGGHATVKGFLSARSSWPEIDVISIKPVKD